MYRLYWFRLALFSNKDRPRVSLQSVQCASFVDVTSDSRMLYSNKCCRVKRKQRHSATRHASLNYVACRRVCGAV